MNPFHRVIVLQGDTAIAQPTVRALSLTVGCSPGGTTCCALLFEVSRLLRSYVLGL